MPNVVKLEFELNCQNLVVRQTYLNVPVYTLCAVYVCTVRTNLVYLLHTCLLEVCESGLSETCFCVLRCTRVPDCVCLADTVGRPETGYLYALYTGKWVSCGVFHPYWLCHSSDLVVVPLTAEGSQVRGGG